MRRDVAGLFSSAQARAARGLLGWSVERTAAAADLEAEALRLFEEAEGDLGERELLKLSGALRRAGVLAVPAVRAGEGVRFSHPRSVPRTPFAHEQDGLPDWLPLAPDRPEYGA